MDESASKPVLKIAVGGPRMSGKTALIQSLIVMLEGIGAHVHFHDGDKHKQKEKRPFNTLVGKQVIIYEINAPVKHIDVIDGVTPDQDKALAPSPEPYHVRDVPEASPTKSGHKSPPREPIIREPKPRLNLPPSGTRVTLWPDSDVPQKRAQITRNKSK